MFTPVTLEELDNARQDVESLEVVVNGLDTEVVNTRLGQTYPTLSKFIKDSQTLVQSTIDSVVDDNMITTNLISAGDGETQADKNSEFELLKFDTGIVVTTKYSDSVVRTQAEKNSDFVNVKDFGAIGDGIADDTDAVQRAINSYPEINFGSSGDSYRLRQLTLRSGTVFSGVATLDFSQNSSYANSYNSPLIIAKGTASEPILLTTNATQGSLSLYVQNTEGIKSGDIIEIATPNVDGGFIDSSTQVHNGELLQVESVVNSTTLKLSETIIDEYGYSVDDGAQIRKINTLEGIVLGDGITIRGKGRPSVGNGDYGLILHYAKGTKVHANFIGVDYNIARFEGCYDTEVSGCQFLTDPKGTNSSLNYGVVPSGSTKHMKVFNNHFQNMRHGFVTSHLSSALGFKVWGVSRLIDIYNNTFSNTWSGAIATHNDTDRLNIYNNKITNCVTGINPRERNVWIYNNKFIANDKDILLSAHPKNIHISRNFCSKRVTGNFLISAFDGSRAITNINIIGNELGEIENARGINLVFTAADNPSKIIISNNIIDVMKGESNLSAGISVVDSPVSSLIIKDNIIRDVSVGLGIYVKSGGVDVLINNNTINCINDEKGIATQGTYINLVGKGNFVKTTGVKWSGADKTLNYSSLNTDNTWL